MRFHDFLKAVGTGPKGNRHLSREEMKEAMGMMLDGTALPEQTSAFLLGWRVQIEDKDELLGAIDAMNERIQQSPIKKSLEIGYPLDGKIKSLPIMLLAAQLVPKVLIVIQGDRAQPSKLGFNPKDFYENTKLSDNIHYFDRANFFPQLSKLTDLRRALGLRTAFNTIEKLHNVASSDFALVGMHHLPYFDLYKELYGQKYKRLIIVRGSEGTPEVLKKTTILVVEGGHSHSIPIDPAYYDLKPFEAKKEMSLQEMISQLEKPTEQILGYARLNAALLLYAANQAPSIEDAYASLKSNYDKLCKKLLKD
ncbi:glycosyl transferase [Sulfurimonas sp. MAG313]|nr:glycosyl transferase [Sulfurimonas sp. MAG313]MDF1881481.1 glycosyl transferase [Sulfurimonas sp. MAG313]